MDRPMESNNDAITDILFCLILGVIATSTLVAILMKSLIDEL